MKKILNKSAQGIMAASLATGLAIAGECTSSSGLKILAIIVGFFVAIIFILHNSTKDVKDKLKSDIQYTINKYYNKYFFLRFSYVWEQIEVKILFEIFKNEYDVVRCIAEAERIDEHTVRSHIRNKTPDLFLVNSNKEVCGIIRFGEDNIPEINIYDLEGNFIAVVNEDGKIANKHGVYIAEIYNWSGTLVAFKYSDSSRRRTIKENIPRIIVTNKIVEEMQTQRMSIDGYLFSEFIKDNQMQVLDSLA